MPPRRRGTSDMTDWFECPNKVNIGIQTTRSRSGHFTPWPLAQSTERHDPPLERLDSPEVSPDLSIASFDRPFNAIRFNGRFRPPDDGILTQDPKICYRATPSLSTTLSLFAEDP